MHSSSRARFVIGDEVGDLVKRLKRRLSQFAQHESGSVFDKHRFDQIDGGRLACISFKDAFFYETNLPGFTLYVFSHNIICQKAVGLSRCFGQRFDLFIQCIERTYIDDSNYRGYDTPVQGQCKPLTTSQTQTAPNLSNRHPKLQRLLCHHVDALALRLRPDGNLLMQGGRDAQVEFA